MPPCFAAIRSTIKQTPPETSSFLEDQRRQCMQPKTQRRSSFVCRLASADFFQSVCTCLPSIPCFWMGGSVPHHAALVRALPPLEGLTMHLRGLRVTLHHPSRPFVECIGHYIGQVDIFLKCPWSHPTPDPPPIPSSPSSRRSPARTPTATATHRSACPPSGAPARPSPYRRPRSWRPARRGP